ncbi:MAG: sensor histidine kinase [Lachnospiraceae bacterium]|nr:sensor histidine kinase [Lachnospiraceae bacterium]
MKKQLSEVLKKSTLRQKMNLLCWMSIIPLAILMVYSMILMAGHFKQYDQIVRNITAANAYNLSFKEKLDDTMYRIIIGSENWSNSDEKLKDDDPYAQIQEVRGVFEGLYNITTTEKNKKRINGICKTLNTLQDRVDDILENVQESGHYDENMDMLDMNIRILTSLVQTEIQEYIYYEAASLEIMRQQVARETNLTIQFSFLSIMTIVFVTGTMSQFLGKKITDPIEELCRSTSEVARGNFAVQVHVESGDELETLAESFNSMVGEISDLVEDIKVEQNNLRATELKLLQAQINPHFLYNTLDTIIWLSEDNQKEQVTSMVSSLSDFFRTTLSKGKDYITIQEEESHIKSYLEIQQFRYRDIMSYEIAFEEELLMNMILKLTLQPIVENALYHGIKNKRGLGKITVTGKKQGELIQFTVKDDGIGMNPQTLERLRRIVKGEIVDDIQHGFGMANVQQRIELNYGIEYGIHIESTYGEGTVVTVTIPCITNENIVTNS